MQGGSLRQVGGSLDHLDLSPDHLNYRTRSQVWSGGWGEITSTIGGIVLPGSQVWSGEDQQLDPISDIAPQSDDFEARKKYNIFICAKIYFPLDLLLGKSLFKVLSFSTYLASIV